MILTARISGHFKAAGEIRQQAFSEQFECNRALVENAASLMGNTESIRVYFDHARTRIKNPYKLSEKPIECIAFYMGTSRALRLGLDKYVK